ncbi:ER lumen protein-retaining receptor isoform C [Glycine soja]|uniref:ER lumen protein-retaining receptor isoform C n=1 Tax=Glycine soja TaxID=3848 RepID=A0A445KV44_GLYSO|nr:ER lumen protein-retaining receptor isoform C [Glycine soja]
MHLSPVFTRVLLTRIHSCPNTHYITLDYHGKKDTTQVRRQDNQLIIFCSEMKGSKRPIHAVTTWVRRQPPKIKAFLAVLSALAALLFLRIVVHDHDSLFVAAEFVHALGISVLIYKLTKEKTCAGLSLKSQELTAMFLGVRLYCSFVMEYDIHTLLDMATLATTLWVIYMIRFKLKSSYMDDKDNLAIYYVVIPCAVLSLLIHPTTRHHPLNRILWAFCVYLEAVSVLPQLRVMQNTKIVEPFTAHYVFALGVARFLSCAHWVLQVCQNLNSSKFLSPNSGNTYTNLL